KKLVIFPSTFGPFLYGWTTKLFQHVFPKIDLVYARDQKSYDICKKLLKTDKNIVKTSDVAIFQSWEDKKNEFKKKYNKPIIGISVMKWIYVANIEDTAYSNYASYVDQMVKLIDEILLKYNVHVILYPTNFPVHGGKGDDVEVCEEICRKCNRPYDVSYLNDLISPHEFKSMLSASEINIVTRMHACILSTSAYIPTIGIAYLFKLKEYMNDIGLADFCVDIEYFEHNKVFQMFEEMWYRKQEISKNLQNIIENRKVNLAESVNKIESIIYNEGSSHK
ncbi:MAG TPA: polysaccharide pyruvyl transferase family protein, partial [Bacteroidales bacterium]|nr:polysaccharide pyruvyl transferase family protein [Bacteroidales bacterium]